MHDKGRYGSENGEIAFRNLYLFLSISKTRSENIRRVSLLPDAVLRYETVNMALRCRNNCLYFFPSNVRLRFMVNIFFHSTTNRPFGVVSVFMRPRVERFSACYEKKKINKYIRTQIPFFFFSVLGIIIMYYYSPSVSRRSVGGNDARYTTGLGISDREDVRYLCRINTILAIVFYRYCR